METTPRKGMSKGCLIGLIIGLVVVVLVILFFVLVYVFRGTLAKTGATVSVREAKTILATAPPDGIDTVQFNALADAFIDKVSLESDDEFEALALFVQQITGAVKDRQLSREEVMTAAAAMIGLYPDIEQYWIPKQEEAASSVLDTLSVQDTLGVIDSLGGE